MAKGALRIRRRITVSPVPSSSNRYLYTVDRQVTVGCTCVCIVSVWVPCVRACVCPCFSTIVCLCLCLQLSVDGTDIRKCISTWFYIFYCRPGVSTVVVCYQLTVSCQTGIPGIGYTYSYLYRLHFCVCVVVRRRDIHNSWMRLIYYIWLIKIVLTTNG